MTTVSADLARAGAGLHDGELDFIDVLRQPTKQNKKMAEEFENELTPR